MIDKLEPQLVFNRYIWLKTFKLKYTNENIERLTRLWKSAGKIFYNSHSYGSASYFAALQTRKSMKSSLS